MTISSGNRQRESSEPLWVEWAAGMISGLLIVLMIAWLGFEALTKKEGPPQLSVQVKEISPQGQGFLVSFDVINKGPSTAASVKVVGEIHDPNGAMERADTTFDYVPGQSTSKGGLFFRTDPANRSLTLSPAGYTEP